MWCYNIKNGVAIVSKSSVINKEYEQLQEDISKLRMSWYEQLPDTIVAGQAVTSSTPIIPQVKLSIDTAQYEDFMKQLITVMEEKQPQLTPQLNKVASLIDDQKTGNFATAAMEMNTAYFDKFAADYQLEAWLILFVAENAIRPYLQKAAEELKPSLEKIDGPRHCPACGEPPRMATIGQTGKMEVTCPRCYYTWGIKKISCAHCGTDNHEDIVVIKIDGDERHEIHGCKNCHCYTKVIKTASMIRVPNADLLDIKTIHLDYIAQEKGYESACKGNTAH